MQSYKKVTDYLWFFGVITIIQSDIDMFLKKTDITKQIITKPIGEDPLGNDPFAFDAEDIIFLLVLVIGGIGCLFGW